MTELPCPACGADLVFFEQYQRHYCPHCQQYAPEGYGAHGAGRCPTCGGILSYVAQYDRFYCFRCNAYAPLQPPGAGSSPPAAPAQVAVSTGPAVTAVEKISPEGPPAEEAFAPRGEEASPEGTAGVPGTTLPEEEWTLHEKPPLVKEEILGAKKSRLMDLCKAYDLDPTGTKEQLQERLLSYLGELETENRVDTGAPAEERVTAPSAQPVETREVPEASPSAPQVIVVEEPEERPGDANLARGGVGPQETHAREEGERVAAPQAAPEPPTEPRKVEHPCPTCGRELSYVSQYDRWYCYSCQRYAPAVPPKRACPTCGASLRWIERYERWWCDACQRYAPADLPGPGSLRAESAPASTAQAGAQATARRGPGTVHGHHSPASGIGLLGLGLGLYLVHAIFVEFPTMFTLPVTLRLAPDVAATLQFFAFLFVVVGAMAGLWSLRDRR